MFGLKINNLATLMPLQKGQFTREIIFQHLCLATQAEKFSDFWSCDLAKSCRTTKNKIHV
jgi:hypothetical protein